MLSNLLPLVADAAVRVTLVLSVAWIVTLAMYQAAASTRHALWACAIICALLIPPAALLAPQWHVQAPASLAKLAPDFPDAPASAVSSAPLSLRAPSGTVAPGRGATDDAPRASSLSSSVLMAAVWLIGTTLVLAYLGVGVVGGWWLRRSARPLNAEWVDDAHALAEALEIRQRVVFAEAAVGTPMVSGLWRPWIIVPRDAHAWPERRLRVALLHELAHVKRRDCLTQTLAQIVCAIHWFNPFAWLAARRLRAEREGACDDFVLAAGTKGSDYAGHLLEIAQGAQRGVSPFTLTGVAMARRSELEGRLMAILDPALRRSSARHTRMMAAAVLVVASVPIAGVHLTGSDPVQRAVTTTPQEIASTSETGPAGRAISSKQPGASQNSATPSNNTQAAREPNVQVALTRTLVAAAQRGDQELIESLIAAGADIDGAIIGDGTALIVAAQRGYIDIVRRLLDDGANVNAGVSGDGTPLIAAAQRGHMEIAKLLIERGADIALPFPGDGSPLIGAAQRGHLEMAALLLDRGADIEQVVPGDENALIGASAGGHLPIVRMLVTRGANVNARIWVDQVSWRPVGQGEWRTPLSVATRAGHTAIVSYLRSVGARD